MIKNEAVQKKNIFISIIKNPQNFYKAHTLSKGCLGTIKTCNVFTNINIVTYIRLDLLKTVGIKMTKNYFAIIYRETVLNTQVQDTICSIVLKIIFDHFLTDLSERIIVIFVQDLF